MKGIGNAHMKKKLFSIVVPVMLIILMATPVIIDRIQKDRPPSFSLNGTKLDLSSLLVSDMNDAGFYLNRDDDASMVGGTYEELLAYYAADDTEHTLSLGGVSTLNRSRKGKKYPDCEIFEITANSRNSEGIPTGLSARVNDVDVFGKTKEELIEAFGEDYAVDAPDGKLRYYTRRKQYSITFSFDEKTGECFRVFIRRTEDSVIR